MESILQVLSDHLSKIEYSSNSVLRAEVKVYNKHTDSQVGQTALFALELLGPELREACEYMTFVKVLKDIFHK